MLKTKLGLLLAGIYLVVVVYSLIDYYVSPPAIMFEFSLLILTAPWSFILTTMLDNSGVLTHENGSNLIYRIVAFSGLINGAVLYLIGALISRLIKRCRAIPH
jgi:hypothetical protein